MPVDRIDTETLESKWSCDFLQVHRTNEYHTITRYQVALYGTLPSAATGAVSKMCIRGRVDITGARINKYDVYARACVAPMGLRSLSFSFDAIILFESDLREKSH